MFKGKKNRTPHTLSRRIVLKGLGGVTLGLPLLESLSPNAYAETNGNPKFVLVVATGNGVRQEGARFDPQNPMGEGMLVEPETFWLRGGSKALTTANMREDSDRSLSVLQDYARDLIIIDGMKYADGLNGTCLHALNSSKLLTGSKLRGNNRPSHMSIDQRIADELNPAGVGPLTAIAGKAEGSLTSFSADGTTRTMQSNPLRNFQKVIGGAGEGLGDLDALTQRNKFVNDLLRDQLDTLQSASWLSAADKRKIEAHRDLVQDIEIRSCELASEDLESRLEAHDTGGLHQRADRQMQTAQLHIDVMALAVACGYSQVGVLQIGEFLDMGKYVIDGSTTINNFHQVSHRVEGSNPLEAHEKMDRYFFQKAYLRLLDKLKERDLINQGMTIWANQQADGNHLFERVPMVIAGSAGGYLKTGQCVKKEIYNPKILNTILTASGVRKANGAPVDDFGNQPDSVKKGLFDDIVA